MKIICTTFCSLFSLLATVSLAQVQGTVTDLEDNSLLPGVNILIKGTSTGTVTDVNGHIGLPRIVHPIPWFSPPWVTKP